MTCRALLLPLLLMLSFTITAGEQEARALASPAEAEAEALTPAETVLARTDESLGLARDGVYGPIKRGGMERLEAAQDTIHALLDDHDSLQELSPQDRLALHQAQETIRTTLRMDDRSRIICERSVQTGSRLGSTECLTVAQREERAAAAREGVDKVQRNICYPGEGQSCIK